MFRALYASSLTPFVPSFYQNTTQMYSYTRLSPQVQSWPSSSTPSSSSNLFPLLSFLDPSPLPSPPTPDPVLSSSSFYITASRRRKPVQCCGLETALTSHSSSGPLHNFIWQFGTRQGFPLQRLITGHLQTARDTESPGGFTRSGGE